MPGNLQFVTCQVCQVQLFRPQGEIRGILEQVGPEIFDQLLEEIGMELEKITAPVFETTGAVLLVKD